MRSVRAVPGDDGFSLVETLVALAVLGTFMAAMGPFAVGSIRVMARQGAAQAATQLADSAIEQVRSVRGSSLLSGRGRTASTAQWNAPAPAKLTPYLAAMQLTWDQTLPDNSPSGPDAPISTATQTMKVEKTTYQRTVYVGVCDIYLVRGGSGDCQAPPTPAPTTDVTKDLKFFRVVVLITWPDTTCAKGTPEAGTCSYVASTLVARGSEPIFDIHRPAPLIVLDPIILYLNVASDQQFQASGGQLPNIWTPENVPSGMPAGTSIANTGYIQGAPTELGDKLVRVRVTDKLGRSDVETVTVRVIPPPALAAPADVADHAGETVTQTLTATGGLPPYKFKATGLPASLSLNASTGQITGTAPTAGAYTVAGTATDSNGQPVTRQWTYTVYPAVTLAAVPDQTTALGSPLAVAAAGSVGGAALTYTVTGRLPAGVVLDPATGNLTGTPTESGRFLPTVTVTDGLGGTGGTAAQQFPIVVTTSTALTFTAPAFPAADRSTPAGTPASVAFQTNGAALGLTPALTATGLPPGTTFNAATGTIGGTPGTTGSYLVTVVATGGGQTSSLTFRWTIT